MGWVLSVVEVGDEARAGCWAWVCGWAGEAALEGVIGTEGEVGWGLGGAGWTCGVAGKEPV